MITAPESIQYSIQLALAPVFLLTAVATLVAAITTRLARTVDRMRFVQNELAVNEVLSEKLKRHYQSELIEYKMRSRLCTLAIFFDVLSGVFISLTVLELFLGQTAVGIQIHSLFAIATFVAGIIAFTISLITILIEVIYAYRSTSWHHPYV
jgi:hypothetical protein